MTRTEIFGSFLGGFGGSPAASKDRSQPIIGAHKRGTLEAWTDYIGRFFFFLPSYRCCIIGARIRRSGESLRTPDRQLTEMAMMMMIMVVIMISSGPQEKKDFKFDYLAKFFKGKERN